MKVAETDADKQTAELVQLAQRELHGDSALSDEAGFARLPLRQAQPAASQVMGWLVGGAALVSAGALALGLARRAHDERLTFEGAGAALSADGHIVGKEG